MSSTEWKDLLQHIDGESTATTRTTTSASLAQLRDNHPSNNNNNNNHVIEKNDVFDDVSTNQHPQRDNQISDWEASVSLAKAIMGAGSFALPWAFSKMGYITGPIFMTLLLTMSVYSIQLLVQCCSLLRRKLEQQQQQQHQQSQSFLIPQQCSYVDVARSTFGTTGARCAYIASMSASIGVCGSYLVFIASNIESLLETSTLQDKDPSTSTSTTITTTQDTTTTFTRTTTWIWMILPVAVLLSSIRDMKYFAMASFLGDLSVILGMVVVMVYGIMDTTPTNNSSQSWWGDNCVAVGSLRDMALAFGSIGYLFLVHFLVIPIESFMERPQHFPKVATVTFTACAIGSGIFGIVGYLMFETETEQIVLLNVRHGSVFVIAVKVLLCIDLILTYPVVMRPSIVILEESMDLWWKQRQVIQQKKTSIEATTTTTTHSEHHHHHPKVTAVASTTTTLDGRHFFACTILGVVAASASSFIPAFGILSGLVGGVSQTFLAFVLPPLMWTKIQQQQQQTNLHRSSSLSASILWDLPIREKGLVVCGCVLIVWTLHSTWTELRTTTT
ncbi:transmembrane amino acid transporter [Nitzschia inconspicua]|uniref:Transmembrane amino acid transporter n=1 Tax=Nitzschia inconspicua TaxID=303405 RepID=A0A9K3PNT8_9STRA|nr:transmembrane amino acid transporter [Nitzschia inconspicua]